MRATLFTLPLLAACASPDLMPAGELATPPASAIYWSMNLRYPAHPFPDCNDYARATAARLAAAGDHPRYAAALTETGEGHMVVTLDTPRGTLVYDNRYRLPQPWRHLPYTWLEVSAPDDATIWYKIAK